MPKVSSFAIYAELLRRTRTPCTITTSDMKAVSPFNATSVIRSSYRPPYLSSTKLRDMQKRLMDPLKRGVYPALHASSRLLPKLTALSTSFATTAVVPWRKCSAPPVQQPPPLKSSNALLAPRPAKVAQLSSTTSLQRGVSPFLVICNNNNSKLCLQAPQICFKPQ